MPQLTCLETECDGRMGHGGTCSGGERYVCQRCNYSITVDLPPVLSTWANALSEGT